MSGLELFESVSIVLGLTYFFSALYILSQQHPSKNESNQAKTVAVLVAMRNEEDSIATCLESLLHQNYPQSFYHVLILDDRSSDRSKEIASAYCEKYEHFSYKMILNDRNGLSGKMNVLAHGMDDVDAEIVLITDADCIVPPNWIKTQVGYFDDSTGMVGGLTSLSPTALTKNTLKESHLFAKIQTLDWLYLQTIAAGCSQAGKPITILGNNFAFRKQAYDEVGGFEKIGFSVTEDFKLMQAMSTQSDWTIRHTTDLENTIYSKPVRTYSSFYTQRHRWIKGGRGARPFAYLISGLSLFAHLAIVGIFSISLWTKTAAIAVGLIMGMDYFIVKRAVKITGQKNLLIWFLPFELFYIANLIVFSISLLIPQKVRWKDRKF